MKDNINENLLLNNQETNSEGKPTKKKSISTDDENDNDEIDGFKNDPEETIKIEHLSGQVKYDKSVKVILIGDAGVGKTSIINRLLNNNFKEKINSTLSPECYDHVIKINDYVIRMVIWDTAGQEKYNSIIANHFQSAEAAIFVYSIDNTKSYNNIKEWYKQLINIKSDENLNVKKILLGNKKDLEKKEVDTNIAEAFATEFGFQIFAEITSKNDEMQTIFKVSNIFDSIGKLFYDEYCTSKSDTVNYSNYNYVASKSILNSSGEKSNSAKNVKVKNKGCCC